MALATALLIIFGNLGITRDRGPLPLMWATGLWATFALWEWFVSCEANIRVDLFLISPVLLMTTIWALGSSFRGHRRA